MSSENNLPLFIYLVITASIACKVFYDVRNSDDDPMKRSKNILYSVLIWLGITFILFQYYYLYGSKCLSCSSISCNCDQVEKFNGAYHMGSIDGSVDDSLKDIPRCEDYQRIPDSTGDRLTREVDARKKKFDREIAIRHQDKANTTDGYCGPYQRPGSKSEKHVEQIRNRLTDADIYNDLIYTDHNHLPMAAGYKSHDYEYGYSYIPPEKWYPQPVRPPICVTSNPIEVAPALTDGAPANLKEFYSSSKITGPSQMSSNYIYDKMNS